MSRKEKLIEKLKNKPKNFTFDELESLMGALGFQKSNKGKTSGSRVKFIRGNVVVIMHKPHPRKELLAYQVNQILEILEREDVL